MKFGTIGTGTFALAFAREALATGHEVVLSSRRGPESLDSKVRILGTARPRPRSRRPQASTMSRSPLPGRMSRTRCAACQRGTAEYSSTQPIRSSSVARPLRRVI
jgi:NADP oxidoreductase coenzyme F420-dependent